MCHRVKQVQAQSLKKAPYNGTWEFDTSKSLDAVWFIPLAQTNALGNIPATIFIIYGNY